MPRSSTPRIFYKAYNETPSDWTTMPKLKPQNKKDIVKFLAAGLAAVLLGKIEKAINKQADDYFGPDEEPKKELTA
ncbi:hypothetical protein SEA_GIRLPOWER_45 [Streptomyces phage GirlPower]|nr:hypothetical protein SEA_GIRLPOWER_45 [Streptomyces phage GirlPower]